MVNAEAAPKILLIVAVATIYRNPYWPCIPAGPFRHGEKRLLSRVESALSIARMVKLVNTADLKSAAARPAGSSPVPGTKDRPSFVHVRISCRLPLR